MDHSSLKNAKAIALTPLNFPTPILPPLAKPRSAPTQPHWTPSRPSPPDPCSLRYANQSPVSCLFHAKQTAQKLAKNRKKVQYCLPTGLMFFACGFCTSALALFCSFVLPLSLSLSLAICLFFPLYLRFLNPAKRNAYVFMRSAISVFFSSLPVFSAVSLLISCQTFCSWCEKQKG